MLIFFRASLIDLDDSKLSIYELVAFLVVVSFTECIGVAISNDDSFT